jgi:hypothetical protein
MCLAPPTALSDLRRLAMLACAYNLRECRLSAHPLRSAQAPYQSCRLTLTDGGTVMTAVTIKRQRWAWYMYDFGNSAYASVVLMAVFSTYFKEQVVGGAAGSRL